MKNKTELKTLNELKPIWDARAKIDRNQSDIIEGLLKAEAVKWVKRLKRVNAEVSEGDGQLLSMSLWIFHFFNLTEEDLRTGDLIKLDEKELKLVRDFLDSEKGRKYMEEVLGMKITVSNKVEKVNLEEDLKEVKK